MEERQQRYHVIMVGLGTDGEPPVLFPDINGKTYSIMRGKIVPVPEEVVHCLNNAVEPAYTQKEDGTVEQTGEKQRYPFSILFRNIQEKTYEELKKVATKPGGNLTEEMCEKVINRYTPRP